jgi:hypothetical protein
MCYQNAVIMFRGEPKNVQLAISNLTETIIRLETPAKMNSNNENAEDANAF